jgi:hypothetical protein
MASHRQSYNISLKSFLGAFFLFPALDRSQSNYASRGFVMLSMIREKRARQMRNRDKAKALVEQYGDRAETFVHEKIAATAWQIRDHAHWKRIESHVKVLLRD